MGQKFIAPQGRVKAVVVRPKWRGALCLRGSQVEEAGQKVTARNGRADRAPALLETANSSIIPHGRYESL